MTRVFEAPFFVEGVRKFALGFLYKAVFADHLAAVVNPIFSPLPEQSPLILFGGCLGFYGQIYFDFAGYSLMAIGVAHLLGYRLPDNFNFPYRATSLIDFWHRWHISLSTWLRNYVYIPLGGSRCSLPRNYLNIIVTMLLGGLWHGASWNYLLWGGVHGLALCVNHLWRRLVAEKIALPQTISWSLTQVTVFCCWIPFRASSWQDTAFIFQQFWKGCHQLLSLKLSPLAPAVIRFPWLLIILPLFCDMLLNGSHKLRDRYAIRSTLIFYGMVAVALLVALLFMPSGTVNFIYF
jgi:D-alanyl-lipoteichoic acid acyltransferase DltB (MBOAT superfamily)